jgi:pSer/pThr/pTyr-binding forkhead associated (FHA) protein
MKSGNLISRLPSAPPPLRHPETYRIEYGLEVIKSGTLIEERPITDTPYVTFGRSPTTDILLEHPTASRLHAVLQFRGKDGAAFLIDCGSTHGTFINKQRVNPNVMARLRCVGGGGGVGQREGEGRSGSVC